MKIRIPGHFTHFFLFTFCASGCLFGQNDQQTLFEGLEDVAAYIAARREVIAEKVDLIHQEFKTHKRVTEGISAEEGRSGILVSGHDRPDLFDHAAAISILFGHLNSSIRDIRIRGLIARGFRQSDLDILTFLLNGPDNPENRKKLLLQGALEALPLPSRKQASDGEIEEYLTAGRLKAGQVLDQWAAEVLSRFPLRTRRILMSYAYEEIVPKSYVTQWLPINDHDIRHFRAAEEAQ